MKIVFLSPKGVVLANSIDPDKMSHATFHLQGPQPSSLGDNFRWHLLNTCVGFVRLISIFPFVLSLCPTNNHW